MNKTILILGGAGSVALAIAKKLYTQTNTMILIDIKDAPSHIPDMAYRKIDILKKGGLSEAIESIKPDVIVNSINLATLYSHNTPTHYPDLIDFYRELYSSLRKLAKPVHYLQIGTTGTGGLGFNVPFTHGENLDDLPLIHKAAFAGITTALLTILSRSFSEKVYISELKPGLAIFQLEHTVNSYRNSLVVLTDGGENGRYTYNELAILTRFMGFTSVEKIATKAVSILNHTAQNKSINGEDVIDALNATIIKEESDDAQSKSLLLAAMKRAEEGRAIIATGHLGPASLTRDLLVAAFVLSEKVPNTSPNVFIKAWNINTQVQDTLSYIKEHNPHLSEYLNQECSFERYTILMDYKNNAHQPWELVEQKILAKM